MYDRALRDFRENQAMKRVGSSAAIIAIPTELHPRFRHRDWI